MVLIVSSFAVLNRSQFARWIGIIAGALLSISALWWMPYYPVWSLVYILTGFLVVYGLAVHGGRVDLRLLTLPRRHPSFDLIVPLPATAIVVHK